MYDKRRDGGRPSERLYPADDQLLPNLLYGVCLTHKEHLGRKYLPEQVSPSFDNFWV